MSLETSQPQLGYPCLGWWKLRENVRGREGCHELPPPTRGGDAFHKPHHKAFFRITWGAGQVSPAVKGH